MSGIIVAHRSIDQNLVDSMVALQQGAGFPTTLNRLHRHWRIVVFAPLLDNAPTQIHESDDGAVAATSGAFFYAGRYGEAALAIALQQWRNGTFDVSRALGHFAIVLADQDRVQLFTDTLPSNRIYHDARGTIYSTLFLSVVQTLSTAELDVQGLYEYAWAQANHSLRTVFRDIRALPPYSHVIFSHEQASVTTADGPDWFAPDMSRMADDRIVRHYADTFQQTLNPVVSAFGTRIKSALSGGYDSRLIAAGLMSLQNQAQYYVYGGSDDADRKIATALADRFSLNFRAIEKPAATDMQNEYVAQMQRKFIVYDGLYPEGLFDNGIDLPDRLARLQDADILAIGSGGESLRNFFYLRDGRYTPDQIISTFYSGYDTRACTDAFDEARYRRCLAEQLAGDVGVDADRPMARSRVEAAYPLFRVRYWSTREIAVNQRFGWTYYPYLADAMVSGTPTVPLHLKTHGILEARMIARLHPGLASANSDYGFPFDRDPPLAYRAKMLSTYLRPTWLRRHTYRIRHRGPRHNNSWQNADYLGQLVDLSLPLMSAYFHPDDIGDAQAYNRVATLEYLVNWQKTQQRDQGKMS